MPDETRRKSDRSGTGTDEKRRVPPARNHLPLNPKDFQLLMLVFDRPLHGYGIVRESDDRFGEGVLDLGTLYRLIGRLTKRGLLEEVTESQDDENTQRRYYRATELGRSVARAEGRRLKELLDSERGQLLWEKP